MTDTPNPKLRIAQRKSRPTHRTPNPEHAARILKKPTDQPNAHRTRRTRPNRELTLASNSKHRTLTPPQILHHQHSNHDHQTKQIQTTKIQLREIKSQHRFSHGGTLRNQRAGRKQRPLSTKESLHVVFKINKTKLLTQSLRSTKNLNLIRQIMQKYASKFFIHLEQISVQKDHIHALIKAPRRNHYQHFFRVTAGQIAQRFEKEGFLQAPTPAPTQTPTPQKLWKYRPFTRVIRTWTALTTIKNYIQLNEKEALGHIPYQKHRTRGMSAADWSLLYY